MGAGCNVPLFYNSFIKAILIILSLVIGLHTSNCFTINSYQRLHHYHPGSTRIISTSSSIGTSTSTSISSTKSKTSSNSKLKMEMSQKIKEMNTLHERLQACNVADYCFVNDQNQTDQYSPSSTSSESVAILKPTSYIETKFLNAIHVKTLVWKGIYLQSNPSENNTNAAIDYINCTSSSTTPSTPSTAELNKPFYFVTALRIEDKVDVKSLRAHVRREWPKKRSTGGMLILQMAERDIAEQLTGFTSGSMPPGWHTVQMAAFIDECIIDDANLSLPSSTITSASLQMTNNTNEMDLNGSKDENIITNEAESSPETETETNTEAKAETTNIRKDSYSHVIMSVGSGTEDYSLHVSLQDLINSSSYNTHSENENDEDDVIQQYKNSEIYSSGYMGRQICSFSRKSVERNTKQKHQKQQEKHELNKKFRQHNCEKLLETKKILKDLTRKAFNVAARKRGKTQEVKRMIEEMGDKFSSFMHVDEPNEKNVFAGELNKNALHYAAWKGDIETVTLLINTAKQYSNEMVRDPVNTISTGEGNYGKTPIFYSITQCRDDAVLLLLSHGADLLIVNNKGQTPCSLSVNKLKKETCEFMCQMETHQLKAGGTFRDYRESHSDGKRYGDLDPRFIRAGDVNMDDDLMNVINEHSKLEDLSNVDLNMTSLPRSLRNTDALMRRQKWLVENEQIASEKSETISAGPIEVSIDTDPKLNGKDLSAERTRTENQSNNPTGRKVVNYKKAKPIAKLLDGTELDITLLPTLSLRDVLSSSSDGSQMTCELIDDEAGLLTFQFAVDEAMSQLNDDDDDNTIINTSWGLDCEWRPSHISGQESPIAVLQISSRGRAFVIDVQTLLQPGIKNDNTDMTSSEIALSETLTKLFVNPQVRILGFGIGQDLNKLSVSFPHVPCFREFNSVIDLQSLSRQVYPGTPKTYMSSLQKAVAILLRKRLDKTEQCSQWDSRPLSASQLQYASLDATILPKLLEKKIQGNPTVEKENGFYFRKHSYLQTSFRFKFLSNDGSNAYRVPMGSIKRTMSVQYARQTWPTFKQTPAMPEVMPLHEQALKAASKTIKMKEKKTTKDKRMKRNPISVSVLTGDLTDLPTPGITLGYTKESVIERVVRKQVVDSLPDDAYLQFNRRGGIIELGNTFLLFVNFGVGKVHPKYRNEFLSEGRQVTFTIKQSRYEDGELLQTLLTPQDEAIYYKKTALFFIKASNQDKFMFCGKVKYSDHEEKDGDLVDLILELVDFDILAEGSSNSDGETKTYMNIVEAQKDMYEGL